MDTSLRTKRRHKVWPEALKWEIVALVRQLHSGGFMDGIQAIEGAFVGQDHRFFPMDRLNLLCVPAERLPQSGISITACEM